MNKVHLSGRSPYTLKDSKEIFLFAYCNREKKLMGYRVWKEAEKLGVTEHSWSSMHNHYKKVIKPQFSKFYSKYENEASIRMSRMLTQKDYKIYNENAKRHSTSSTLDPIENVEDHEFFRNNQYIKNTISCLSKHPNPKTYKKPMGFNFSISRMKITMKLRSQHLQDLNIERLKVYISQRDHLKNQLAGLLADASNKMAELDISLIHWLSNVNARYGISLVQAFDLLHDNVGYEVLARQAIEELSTAHF